MFQPGNNNGRLSSTELRMATARGDWSLQPDGSPGHQNMTRTQMLAKAKQFHNARVAAAAAARNWAVKRVAIAASGFIGTMVVGGLLGEYVGQRGLEMVRGDDFGLVGDGLRGFTPRVGGDMIVPNMPPAGPGKMGNAVRPRKKWAKKKKQRRSNFDRRFGGRPRG